MGALAHDIANVLLAKGMHASDLPYLSEEGWRYALAAVRPAQVGWATVPGNLTRQRVAELMKPTAIADEAAVR